MDLSPWALLKIVTTQLPVMVKLAVTNRLGWSPCSDKQDTRTEIVVTVIKRLMKISKPVGQLQAPWLKDPGIKGQLWIATAKCPAPDSAVRDAVIRGIKELGDGSETYDLPETADVEGEWTGYRAGVDKKAPRPSLASEKDHYDQLMKEVASPVTVLYFHGGAYFLLDPISHRQLTSSLARRTAGRCFSVRYRLAPQTAFPGQLVDALTAYLYLQAPPPGAFHEPVSPKHIVFAGDSAGVSSIHFHGKDVPLELPAGVACNSPWVDICRALPSVNNNAKYDYLEPPSPTGLPVRPMPADEIWPTKPPRAEIFCRASTLTHPLCSPLQATSEMWKGAPPVWMCLGNEGLEDEITVIGRRLYHAGGAVELVGYEGQPHCFGMMFPTTVAGKDCLTKWAEFIKRTVAANGEVERTDEGQWAIAKVKPLQWRPVKLGEMGVDDDLVKKRTEELKGYAIEREAELMKEYEKTGRAKL